MKKPVLLAAVAFALCATALALAGVGLPEYSHRLHPIGLRGAAGLPGAPGLLDSDDAQHDSGQ